MAPMVHSCHHQSKTLMEVSRVRHVCVLHFLKDSTEICIILGYLLSHKILGSRIK